ncbi:hypothetical protein TNCV_662321 [Trichonephila clavipes]|nr:hypothetical protein TNCV_662321 [Trichonephila clavipes]
MSETHIFCKSDDKHLVFSVYRLHAIFVHSSTSAIIPTMQSESLLPIPISPTTSPSNNLNTSASSLSTEIPPVLTTSNKFAALSTEVQPSVSLSESAAITSNKEPFNTSQILKRLKQDSKNRKRRAKEQKAEIE